MTTLACDRRTVAADSRGLRNGALIPANYTKIKLVGGYLFGITGGIMYFDKLIDWWMSGRDPDAYPKMGKDSSFLFIVFFADCSWAYDETEPHHAEHPYPVAYGSGTPYALGALYASACSASAVRVASELDLHTGGPINEIILPTILSTDEHPAKKPTRAKRRRRR